MIPGSGLSTGSKDRSRTACPRPQRPLYVRPPRPPGTTRAAQAVPPKAAGLCVCSLRLSVRTPPFHGGESGSIPLGSASIAAAVMPVRLLPQHCLARDRLRNTVPFADGDERHL